MKKIGYIYYYSETLCKGIICFGNKKDVSIFDKKDCTTTIVEKSLVFFELIDGRISKIETASFSNFDFNLIKSYYSKPYITFNDPDLAVSCEANYDDYGNEIGEPEEGTQEYLNWTLKRISGESVFEFLEDIKSIDIFNVAFWLENYTGRKNHGIKYNEFIELFNIFEVRVRENVERQNKYREWYNELKYEISPLWKAVLQDMEDNELEAVIEKLPELQPFLPIPFAKKNIVMLHESIEFPSKAICATYYSYRIKKNTSASFYLSCIEKLNNVNKKENQFVLERLTKPQKQKLNVELEDNLHTTLLPSIISRINQGLKATNSKATYFDFSHQSVEEVIKIGCFLEELEVINDLNIYSDYLYKFIIERYNSMEDSNKSLFIDILSSSFERWMFSVVSNLDVSLYECNTAYRDLSEYLGSDFIVRIKDLIKSSKLQNSSFEDTIDAFYLEIINETICIERVQNILEDKPVEHYFSYFNRYRFTKDMPLFIQEYLLFSIIDLFDFKDSTTIKWIPETIGVERCKAICFSAETLIKWIKDNSIRDFDEKTLIDTELANRAISRLNILLSKDER